MKRIHLLVQEKLINFIDNLVEMELYPSRSEIMRSALKDWIQKESVFLSNFNSDTKKLTELHRKFTDFNEQLKEQLFPAYYNQRESPIFPLEKSQNSQKIR